MNEKDTLEGDPKPKGLRASNTHETLKPKEVVFTTPTIEVLDETSIGVDFPKAGSYSIDVPGVQQASSYTPHEQRNSLAEQFKAAQPLPVEFYPEQYPYGKVVAPVNKPVLEARVEKLEAQVDALLDRIAKYNLRAAHRI